jgi:hypothetical protein
VTPNEAVSTDATTTPRRRLGRRLGAIALALLLALIDLALVAYLARGQWLGPAVRSTLRAQLPPDVELRFEAIDSDLVGRAACTGLELDAPGVSLRGAALAASFDAGALLDGDWSGLRAARLSADELVLQLPPYADEEHAAAPSLDRALSPWLDLLADGARLDVRSLRVTSAAGDELFAGPLSVSLAAGRSARHLQLIGSDAQAALAVHRDAAGRPTRVELSAELDAPIGLARQLGVDLPLQGGRLELVAHSVLVDGDIVERGRGRLTWTGGALRERGASSLRAEVELDGDQLRATGGLDVPGAQVLTHDLALPWPLDVGTGFDPTRLRGTFAIQVDDLEPWRTLLPDEVASRLPLRGRLRGAFDEDGLHVAGGQLRGDGLDLDVLDGRLPARAATDAPGRIDAILRLDAPLRREFDAPLGIVELVGAAHLVAEGSLDHPRLHGHLDLGPGRAGPLVWERVAGSLAIDERRLDLVAVEADGLRHREAEATTALRGDAAIELPADDAPLRLHVHGLATGRPTAAIAPLLPEEARDFACSAVAVDAALHFPTRATDGIPEGELELAIRDFAPSAEGTATRDTSSATLSLALAHTDQGPRAAVTMRGSASPRLLRLTGLDHALIDAAAVVPFRSRLTAHWDGCEDLRLAGELHLDRLSAGDLPEGSASLRGSFGRRELRIDAFALRGAIDADLHGTVRLDERPQPIDVAGFARIADAAVLQPLWPDAPTGAAGHLEILAQGPWTAPQLDLRAGVMLLDEALTRVLVGWPDELGPPPIGPLTAELRVRGRPDAAPTARGLLALGDPGGAELRLSLAGEAPVRLTAIGDDGPQLARGPGVIRGDLHLGATAHELGAGRLTAEWRWDATGLALERIELDAERGGLRGEAQIALPAEDLLRSEVLNAAQLSGRAELRALELGDVVADRLGLQTLSGRLTGEVTLGGSGGRARTPCDAGARRRTAEDRERRAVDRRAPRPPAARARGTHAAGTPRHAGHRASAAERAAAQRGAGLRCTRRRRTGAAPHGARRAAAAIHRHEAAQRRRTARARSPRPGSAGRGRDRRELREADPPDVAGARIRPARRGRSRDRRAPAGRPPRPSAPGFATTCCCAPSSPSS